MPGRFNGKRALVTGASRGIGAAIAERLAAEGAHVALVARTVERHDHLPGSLAETKRTLEKYGNIVCVIAADLVDETRRAGIVPAAVAGLGGPIDILVNNAAASMRHTVVGYSPRRRRVVFEANVFAPLDLAEAAIPGMRASGAGWIVNITSEGAAIVAGPPFHIEPIGERIGIYASSKAALNRWTNALGAELYGEGIRVNAIGPKGAVLSEGAKALVGDSMQPGMIESMEVMVDSVMALCDCPHEVTAQVFASLDLIASWDIEVRGLDGGVLVP